MKIKLTRETANVTLWYREDAIYFYIRGVGASPEKFGPGQDLGTVGAMWRTRQADVGRAIDCSNGAAHLRDQRFSGKRRWA
jgi:hypothetical protein